MEPIRNHNTSQEVRSSFSSSAFSRGVTGQRSSKPMASYSRPSIDRHLNQTAHSSDKPLIRSSFNPASAKSGSAGVSGSEKFRSSAASPDPLFKRLQSEAQGAKYAALKDRRNGVSIADGLSKYKKEKDSQTYFKLVGQVLSAHGGPVLNSAPAGSAAASKSAPGPLQQAGQGLEPSWITLIDSLGQQAQTILQHQSQQIALEYVGAETGLNLSNMSVSEAAESVFSWLSSEGTAGSTAPSAATPGSVTTGVSTTGVSTTGASSIGVSSSPGWGATLVGALGAAYSAYQLIDNWGQNTPQQGAVSGATIGAYIGTQICPGFGTAIGAGLGAIAGAVIGFFHGGKHKDQIARDQMRSELMQLGLVDQEAGITLADGSSYNISLDGGHRYTNVDGTERRAYDVDFSDPLAAQVVGWAQPLAELLYPGNKKLKDDLTGYLVNAALSNATSLEAARQNVLRFYDQLQLTPEKVILGLQTLGQQGALGADLPAYVNGIATLLTGVAEQPWAAETAPNPAG